MILTPQNSNIAMSGFLGFDRLGCSILGAQMTGILLVVDVYNPPTVALLEPQAQQPPQPIVVKAAVNAVDVSSNTTYFMATKNGGGAGSLLLKMAGIKAPVQGDSVTVSHTIYAATMGFVSAVFSGLVDTVTTIREKNGMPIHNVICRQTETAYALQSRPVTEYFTGSAHDLARAELAAVGLTGVLDFDDFDIYEGINDTSPNPQERYFRPSSFFSTVEALLLWLASQAGYGNIHADESGAVHVTEFTSTSAVDHALSPAGITSVISVAAPPALARQQYGGYTWEANNSWRGSGYMPIWKTAARPLPLSSDPDYAAKLSAYRAIDASLSAFQAAVKDATYYDVTTPMNPSIKIGNKVSFYDADAVQHTGIVRGISEGGEWGIGFTTVANVTVMP